MKILMIGGSGFVGSRLSRMLAPSHDLTILDKKGNQEFSKYTIICDIRNGDELKNHVKGYDIVILLAAEHRDDVTPISLYYDVNVQGTQNVLDAMDEHGVKYLVFTSSVAVYGLNKNNPDENHPVDPFNHYGKSKWQAEEKIRKWAEEDNTRSTVIIRPTVIFGEENRGNVYNLLIQIALKQFIQIGSGENKKSMAYVGNVVEFIKYQIETIEAGYKLYNYSDKPDYTMNQLIRCIENTLNIVTPSFHVPYWIGIMGGYFFDLLSFIFRKKLPISSVRIKKFNATTQFSAEKLKETGFIPPYTLEEGLQLTIKSEISSV